jgi:hypothetical protein
MINLKILTKLYSFISFNEAEQELYKRFEDYKTKFNIKG